MQRVDPPVERSPSQDSGDAAASSADRPQALQFEKAEFDDAGPNKADETDETDDAPPELACHRCHQRFTEPYFRINGEATCRPCTAPARALREGPATRRLSRAVLLGVVAAALGAGIYYAVVALTGYEIGLIAIVVGLLVGFGVRLGCGGRGGWGYQLLAVSLTYLAIVTTYVSQIADPMMAMLLAKQAQPAAERAANAADEATSSEHPDADPDNPQMLTAHPDGRVVYSNGDIAPAAKLTMWLYILGIAFVWPFASLYFVGASGVMGLLIVGFALYEAWKINRATPFEIEGPLELSAEAAAG